MELQSKLLMNAFDKSHLVFEKQILSDFNLLRSNAEFFSELTMNDGNNRGLILHPGSNVIFIISTLLSAYSCLLSNSESNEEIIRNLNVGDRVIYEKSPGVYDGIDERGMARVKKVNSLVCYVPPTSFYKIKPYNGNKTTLDARGIRNSERGLFISRVFDIIPNDIPTVINRSVVIVCSRQLANQIMNETEIEYKNRSRIPIHDAFSAAYYTENDVYNFAGNSAKNDPVLKFANKISIARELIFEDQEKKIIGLLINGRDLIDGGLSELQGLLTRRSLKNVTMLSMLGDGDYRLMLDQFPELKLFAWTKEAILSNDLEYTNNHSFSNELAKLSRYAGNIIEKEVILNKLESYIEVNTYNSIKSSLFKIAKNDFTDSETESFVITGYSLLNLFTYAYFPLKTVESLVELGTIGIMSPALQLDKMKIISNKFSGRLGDEMKLVVEGLFQFYQAIYDVNPKHLFIKEKIITMNYGRKKIAIILKKTYYSTIFMATLQEEEVNYMHNCSFFTANNFYVEDLYDEIIVTGALEGNHFGIFSSNTTSKISVIAYPFEEQQYKLLEHKNDKVVGLYNTRNNIKYEWDSEIIDQDVFGERECNMQDIDLKLEEYINNVSIGSTISVLRENNIEGQAIAEIVRVATFESGEKIFFTKHYRPYVLNVSTGSVTEYEVEKINPGDMLIFTRYTDQKMDIVEKLLLKLINSDNCDIRLKESYRKSKHWKIILKEYMDKNDISFRDLSDEMRKLGQAKHETTLRTWLDEDSHIVGPRDSISYSEIALITNDKEMLENPDGFCEACREIRSVRMRILSYIGINIINSVGSSAADNDELFQNISMDIKKLAVVMQVDKIVDMKAFIPAHIANRIQIS